MGFCLDPSQSIIRAFAESVASQKFILGCGQGNDGEAADPNQGGVLEELVGLDLVEGDGLGEQIFGFDFDGGIFVVGGVYGDHGGGADSALAIAGFVDDQFVARFHRAKVPQSHGIVHAVPDSDFVSLEIGEGVCGGFGFE